MAGRYVFHVVSGILFFQEYAWAGWNSIAYVFAYNATYMVPELIVSAIIIAVVAQRGIIDIYV
jgi:thiamine transporter